MGQILTVAQLRNDVGIVGCGYHLYQTEHVAAALEFVETGDLVAKQLLMQLVLQHTHIDHLDGYRLICMDGKWYWSCHPSLYRPQSCSLGPAHRSAHSCSAIFSCERDPVASSYDLMIDWIASASIECLYAAAGIMRTQRLELALAALPKFAAQGHVGLVELRFGQQSEIRALHYVTNYFVPLRMAFSLYLV